MSTSGLYSRVARCPQGAGGGKRGRSGADRHRAHHRLGLEAVESLAPWRRPRDSHGPGKLLVGVALTLPLGGDCRADTSSLQAEPEVYGPVASDPPVSLLIKVPAGDVDVAERTTGTTRRAAPKTAWNLARELSLMARRLGIHW